MKWRFVRYRTGNATSKRIGYDAEMHSPRCVLIVDDNVDSAATMAALLKISGHDVHTAYDGLTAVQKALSIRPAFVFLDIGLPGLDGYGVLTRLRNEPSLTDTCIIAITGHSSGADKERALDAGCDQYLIKPVDPTFLESLLG